MTTTSYNFIFSLKVEGASEDEFLDEIADALIAAGCDDATFSVRYGVPHAEFDREATSFASAVVTAIVDVESVSGVQVTGVEFDELLTPSAIAERTGRTRQNVQQWIAGSRGPSGFPAPASWVVGAKLWEWSRVAQWLQDEKGLTDLPTSEEAEFLAALNGALETHEHLQHVSAAEELRAVYAFLRRDVSALGNGESVEKPVRHEPAGTVFKAS